jgi:hypothetical protein
MLARLCIALVFGLGVSLANAATLSISGGSSATELTNQAPGIPQGTTGYSSTAPTGGSPVSLRLDAFSALKFEYLGSQALNNNTNAPGSRLFSNSTLTLNGTEQGTQYFNLQLPYAVEGSTSNPALRSGQIVLLGLSDGGGGAGDSDFKDMTIPIRVAPVPDTWMMMVAGLVIMGFVVTRRARKN